MRDTKIKRGQHLSSSTEFKKGLAPWNKGKPQTAEQRENNRISHTGLRFVHKNRLMKECPTCKVVFHPQANRVVYCSRKCYGLDNSGDSNHNFVGGLSNIYKSLRGITKYKQWRSDIFQRDNWTCKTCGAIGVYITVHHIKSFRKIIRDNNITSYKEGLNCAELWDENNGITLCEECHKLTDNYKGRGSKGQKKRRLT